MSQLLIDLNLDAGESPEALANGTEEKLYQLVTSVNIACGGHAGDEQTMTEAIKLAKKYNLKIGAHPSYPDKENFGRKIVEITQANLISSLVEQITTLKSICEKNQVKLTHIKPHGALYNKAATDKQTAEAIIQAVKKIDPTLKIVGLANSNFQTWTEKAGVLFIPEAFVDRRYNNDKTLRERKHEDALIKNPEEAASQAIQLAKENSVTSVEDQKIQIKAKTLCIHGDTDQAEATAKAVNKALKAASEAS